MEDPGRTDTTTHVSVRGYLESWWARCEFVRNLLKDHQNEIENLIVFTKVGAALFRRCVRRI